MECVCDEILQCYNIYIDLKTYISNFVSMVIEMHIAYCFQLGTNNISSIEICFYHGGAGKGHSFITRHPDPLQAINIIVALIIYYQSKCNLPVTIPVFNYTLRSYECSSLRIFVLEQ